MLALSRGDDALVIAPNDGASILGWTRRGADVLRHPSPDGVLLGKPGAMGCFPLVPFCNRIAWRRFHWAGRSYELAANFGDHPHAIHGIGWQRPWQLDKVTADSASLTLRHDAIGDAAHAWPFAFTARLTYHLTDNGLSIRIAATNLHPEPAPMGLGTHPWWPRAPGATIAFSANGVWLNRESLPVTHEPVPTAWDHAAGRVVNEERLDNCFTGWHGEARLPHLRITADPIFGNLQVFTPPGADFFCVEPMTHVPDAINRADLPAAQGMTALAPGETLTGTMSFTPDNAARGD